MNTAQEEAAKGSPPADVVIITGMSGAGKSTTAKSLEDLDWYVIENLPPRLLPTMVDLAMRASGTDAAGAEFGDAGIQVGGERPAAAQVDHRGDSRHRPAGPHGQVDHGGQ